MATTASENGQRILPVLPIKNSILFPNLVMPLNVGRPASLEAVRQAEASEDKLILVIAQKDAGVTLPGQKDLFSVGTVGVVKKINKSQQGVSLIVNGQERVRLVKLTQASPMLTAQVESFPFPPDGGTQTEALQRAMLEAVAAVQELMQTETKVEIAQVLGQLKDPLDQVFLLASILGLELEKEQALLEAKTRQAALELMLSFLNHERQVLEMRQKISSQVAKEMGKEQREFWLRRQLRAIQEELGELNPGQADISAIREKIGEAKLPENVREEVEKELRRLDGLSPMAPDYQIVKAHIELVAELPWNRGTEDNLDLFRARERLDEDHFGLKDIKERILEHLAVMKLNPTAKAPILCFVGPPGTGKTSLGQSIAGALGRKFERISLGGLHDEAELRGHRRTYIGAMPGRILQAIRRAGVNNPLLMLDEVDKLGRDFRGDPAAALMEILDPAQNVAFHDNYLDLPFDLSKVLFVATANSLGPIPGPLLDRMEVVMLSGYTDREKLQIAKRYLIPRQRKEAGLTESQLELSDESILQIIHLYTREAGLRQLERAMGRIARKTAMRVAENKDTHPITPDELSDLMGPEKFFLERARQRLEPGVSMGLAWTEAGGEILYIEANLLPTRTGLTVTGQLGKVMKESVETALSYVLSEADWLKPHREEYAKAGVHVHVPAGAIPKDGPSAGVAIAVALASRYIDKAARKDTAMTGEVTLSGLVLPVGGIKEKILAARRADVKRVLLPRANEKDLREVPDEVKSDMEFIFVEEIAEALHHAIPDLPIQASVGDSSAPTRLSG